MISSLIPLNKGVYTSCVSFPKTPSYLTAFSTLTPSASAPFGIISILYSSYVTDIGAFALTFFGSQTLTSLSGFTYDDVAPLNSRRFDLSFILPVSSLNLIFSENIIFDNVPSLF